MWEKKMIKIHMFTVLSPRKIQTRFQNADFKKNLMAFSAFFFAVKMGIHFYYKKKAEKAIKYFLESAFPTLIYIFCGANTVYTKRFSGSLWVFSIFRLFFFAFVFQSQAPQPATSFFPQTFFAVVGKL